MEAFGQTLLIVCHVVCGLSAPFFVVCCGPYVMDPLFTSPSAGQGSHVWGSVRDCPTLVNYKPPKLVFYIIMEGNNWKHVKENGTNKLNNEVCKNSIKNWKESKIHLRLDGSS